MNHIAASLAEESIRDPELSAGARLSLQARPANGAPLKVMHVVLSLDVGGLERIVLDLVRRGQELGQEVCVTCVASRGCLAPQVEALGTPVYCLDKGPGLRVRTVRRMSEVLRDFGPHVVHTHQIGALLYAGWAARRLGVPAVVHTEHINNIKKAKSRLRRLRTAMHLYLGARYADRFFCVSEDIAAQVIGYRLVAQRKVQVVLNGIDTRRFANPSAAGELRGSLGIPADAPVIGTVGRLNEVKRQDLLIEAFADVRREIPGAHLLLVGDGPARPDLETLTGRLGLQASVHFAGYQAEPERFLKTMTIFALPSRMEGTPLVVLEAWAAGLPVVATRVGGVPRMIADGQNGLLVDEGKQASLAAALLRLLRDPEQRRRIAAAGQQTVAARYSLERMAGDYASQYLELLTQNQRRAGYPLLRCST
jgi:glycosyltransferase involved in cell wall biosynthesis